MGLSSDEAFDNFSLALQQRGVRDALKVLVELTDYRFISIFRFSDGKAKSVVHVDRHDLSQMQTDEVADTATYCCYVRDTGGNFTTADALIDPRTADHPAREVVRAYCGIPVMTPEGELLGTLCHYDTEPRLAGQIDLELMLRVSSALAYGNHIPAYLPA